MPLTELLNPNLQQSGGFHFRGMELRFASIFLVVFFVLQYGYSTSRGTAFEHLVIDVATVRPSVAAINLISPREELSQAMMV